MPATPELRDMQQFTVSFPEQRQAVLEAQRLSAPQVVGGVGGGTAASTKIERLAGASLATMTPGGVDPNKGAFPRIQAAFKAFSSALFSPGVPIKPSPQTQEEGPHANAYRSGANVNLVPRAEEGRTPFDWMLNIAALYDTLNMAVLYKRDMMAALEWKVVPRRKNSKPSQAQISEAEERLYSLTGTDRGGKHKYAQWMTAAVWETLVTDALSVYVNRSLTGDVLSFDLIDGSTIKPLITKWGRTPSPDLQVPAYQQVLYGRSIWEGTTNDLIYAPKNVRASSMYGESPTEMLTLTINRTLRRQGFDIAYYGSSNIPEALVTAPAEWSEDQIDKLQTWFDNVVLDINNRRKLTFVPSQTGRLGVFQFKQPVSDPEMERFLDQRTFAMIGVTQQELGFTQDTNRSTGQTQENVNQRRDIPLLRFFAGVFADMFDAAGLPDCGVQFDGEDPEEDKLKQAQVDDIRLRNGSLTLEMIAKRDGHQFEGQAYVYLPTGPIAFPPSPEVLAADEQAKIEGSKAAVAGAQHTQSDPGGLQAIKAAAEAKQGTQSDDHDAGTATATKAPGNPAQAGAGAKVTVQRGDAVESAISAALDDLGRYQRRIRNKGLARSGRTFSTEQLDEAFVEAIGLMLNDKPEDGTWHREVFDQAKDLVRSGVGVRTA